MTQKLVAQIVIDCFDDETCDLKHSPNLDEADVVAILQHMYLILMKEKEMTKH